jgi:hypothetical protein
MMGELVLAEEVRAARQKALTHLLLGFVGGALAAWAWADPWGVLRILPGLGGIVAFLAAASALYELGVGVQYYQKASRLAEIPGGPPGAAGPSPCRRCARPLLPGMADCAVCGEPAGA